MERLTDFELEQIDNQLINDGTNTQVRKLVDEVKEYRQLEKEIGCPLEEAIKVLKILKEKKVDLEYVRIIAYGIAGVNGRYDTLTRIHNYTHLTDYKLTFEEMSLIVDWLRRE